MASRDVMLAARERRIARFETRLEWYGDRVLRNINMGMEQRQKIVGQLLRDKTVINISIPVVKEKGSMKSFFNPITGNITNRRRTIVTERSQPGEFPRADTTRLMKDIFWEYHPETRSVNIGTTLDYGLYLETRMHRSFLRRTLLELSEQIGVILGSENGPAGPLPGQDL